MISLGSNPRGINRKNAIVWQCTITPYRDIILIILKIDILTICINTYLTSQSDK